jgi:PAS domain S-box-containing protein
MNARAGALLGLDRRHLGAPLEPALPAALGARLPAALRACRDAGAEHELEVHLDAAGPVRSLRFLLAPQQDARGSVARIVVTVSDATRQRDALSQSLESELRFRNVVEGSIQGVVVMRNDRALFCNAAYVEIFGFSGAAEVYRLPSVMATVHAADRERLRTLLNEVGAGLRRWERTVFRAVRQDGRTIWIEAFPSEVLWDDAPAVQVALHDVTEREQAKLALQDSEERYRMLVEGSLQGIVVHVEGEPVFANDAAARLAGHPHAAAYLAAAQGQAFPHVAPQDRERVRGHVAELISGARDAVETDLALLRIDGAPAFAQVQARRVSWSGRAAMLTTLIDITERRQLETELRDSRALLQAVFDALPVWVLVKDRNSRFLMANQQMMTDFGIDPAALRGLGTADAPWMDDDLRERVLARDRQVLESGERLDTPDAVARLPDGRRVMARTFRVPLRSEAGQVTGVVTVGQDVTRYVETETALRESEARYRTLVEASLEGITVHQHGRPVLVNDTYARLVGYADAAAYLEVNRDKPLPHIAPEAREEALRRARALEAGEIDRYAWERPTVCLDGARRDLYVQSRRIDWDGAPAVLSTFLDFTERRLAEETLRSSEARYRALIEGSVQGIGVYSLVDYRALLVNEAKVQLAGYASAEEYLRRSHLFDNFSEPDRSRFRARIEQLAAGTLDTFEDELLAYRQDQTPYWAECIASRVEWEGAPAVQITAMDVTARKRAEEALKERQAVLAKQNEYMRQHLSRRRGRQDLAIVADSPGMQRVLHEAEMVARSRVPVLIEGDTGSGKEVVAEFIHRHSDRAEHILSVVNCGALSEALMDAELFGHERGAFTGAGEARPGLIEIADRGTLFLDEIGDLPASAQVRLLRFLERGMVRRVGSNRERQVDVRILAATHKRLREQVKAGTFREDLYHRLLVIRIEVPRLRERVEDIMPLARRFCTAACQEAHLEPLEFSEEARLALTAHDWPGNVRELAHTVQRAVFAAQLYGAGELRPEHLDLPLPGPAGPTLLPIKEVTRRAEQQHVRAVLRHYDGNRRKAAETLGISERHLYRLLG